MKMNESKSHLHGSVRGEIDRLVALSRQRAVWLHVGQLIDGVSGEPFLGADVVFDAERIRFVGTQDKKPPTHLLAEGRGGAGPDLSLPHHVLMPGLIEAHAHLFLDGGPVNLAEREKYLTESGEWMLERVRDCGGAGCGGQNGGWLGAGGGGEAAAREVGGDAVDR